MTLVRFHPMVIIWFSAILKKLVAVCGGCVMLAKPGGFVCAMEGALEAGGGVGADAEAPDAPGAPDGAPEMGRRRTWRSQWQIGIVVQERKAQPPLMTCRLLV
jgi:hypothetical protein